MLQDIFMGNEVIPDIIDRPPRYPLELTYKTVRTFPGKFYATLLPPSYCDWRQVCG